MNPSDIGRMLGASQRLAIDSAGLTERFRRESSSQDAMVYLQALGQANLASEFHARIVAQIEAFDATLDQEHEVGVRLVTFGQAVTFHVTDVRHHNPSLIIFDGNLDNGDPVMLMQHISQISFLLTKLPRPNPEEPKTPYGFAGARPEEQALAEGEPGD